MDNYKHVDMESKCVCSDICLKTCACGKYTAPAAAVVAKCHS